MKNYTFTKIIIAGCIAVPLATYIAASFTEIQKNYLIASLLGSITMLSINEFSELFLEKKDDN